jgi:hypothetical protein
LRCSRFPRSVESRKRRRGCANYTRVATFEGEQSQIREVAETIRKQSESGHPEGVRRKEPLRLTGRDSGKMLAIVPLRHSEEDLRKGDKTLNAMNPPPSAQGIGRRTRVEMFEVASTQRRDRPSGCSGPLVNGQPAAPRRRADKGAGSPPSQSISSSEMTQGSDERGGGWSSSRALFSRTADHLAACWRIEP